MNISLDLGNLAVGIGTSALAIASSWFQYRARNQRIATFRVEWIERLRTKVARFYLIQYEISRARRFRDQISIESASDLGENERLNSLISELEAERVELKTYIRLMLNPKEHKDFSELFGISISGKSEEDRSNRFDIRKKAQQILKSEWQVAKNELRN